jgi:hypothetical protein
MQRVYSSEVSLFLNIFFRAHCSFVPSLHELRISVAVETGHLYSQLLANNHLQFFVLVESATLRAFLQRPNKVTTVEWMVQTLPVIRRNSCVLCGVGLSCWKITPRDRCLGWFLRVVAASYSWRSRRFMCPLAWLQCWWILLQPRVHMA